MLIANDKIAPLLKANLNTSNVNVNLYMSFLKFLALLNLNTSNVNVNLKS